MLTVLASLVGIFGILMIAELLWRYDILKGEYQRKFVHISVTAFVASWPWLMSWQAIQIISMSMLAVLLANHFLKTLHFSAELRDKSYGGLSLAMAFFSGAVLSPSKTVFTIAILHVALADGLAAVIGHRYGANWRYYVFGQLKTVVGTMTFWFVSFCILVPGLLFSYQTITFSEYAVLLLLLPPVLAALENLAIRGLDNLAVPLALILVMRAVG